MFVIEVYYLEGVNVTARVTRSAVACINSRTGGWKVRCTYLRKWLLSLHWEKWLYKHKKGERFSSTFGTYTSGLGTDGHHRYRSKLRRWPIGKRHSLYRRSSLANKKKKQLTQVVDRLCWPVGRIYIGGLG